MQNTKLVWSKHLKRIQVELFNLWTRHAELHIWSPEALFGLTDLFSPLSFNTHSGPWSPYAKTNLGICFALYVQLWIQGPLSAWYMRASNNTLLPFHPLSPSLAMSRISAFICGGKRKKIFEHFVGEGDTLMTCGPLSVAFSCKVCFVQDVSTLRWDEIHRKGWAPFAPDLCQ